MFVSVFVSMCVYVYVCVYVCMCMYVCVCVCVGVYVRAFEVNVSEPRSRFNKLVCQEIRL